MDDVEYLDKVALRKDLDSIARRYGFTVSSITAKISTI